MQATFDGILTIWSTGQTYQQSKKFLSPKSRKLTWITRSVPLEHGWMEHIYSQHDKEIGYLYTVLAASLILHTGLIFALPRLVGIPEAASFLKPGEKVTQVRLVEQPQEPNASEKPPENASAISDRDHTTSKERIPKVIPEPKPPIGKFENFEKRMAALPPSTPEHLEKDVADAPKKKMGQNLLLNLRMVGPNRRSMSSKSM